METIPPIKWAILIWPILAAVSTNRNEKIEGVAIIHALLACYVSWGVITGIWMFPGKWEETGIISGEIETQWYGWFLWVASIVAALLAWIDKDIRFDARSDARFPARHRQMSYVFAFFGVCLVAYGGGYFYIPLGISAVAAFGALSGGMSYQRENEF